MIRLPRVWSSFTRMKSDVFDVPGVKGGRSAGQAGWSRWVDGGWFPTGKRLLCDFLLAGGLIQEEELEAAVKKSACPERDREQWMTKEMRLRERVILKVGVSRVGHDESDDNRYWLLFLGRRSRLTCVRCLGQRSVV